MPADDLLSARTPRYELGWYDAAGQWIPSGPRRRRRPGRRWVVGLAAVVVVAAVLGLVVSLAGGSSGPRRLAIPNSFSGYSRLTNAAAKRVESDLRSTGGSGIARLDRVIDKATIGVYAKNSGDQPVLLAIVVPSTDVTGGEGADQLTSDLLPQIQYPEDYPAGPHGGVTKCGTFQDEDSDWETTCAWSDARTSGVLETVDPGTEPSALAAATRRLQARVGQ